MFSEVRQAILPLALRKIKRRGDLERAGLLIESLAKHWRDSKPFELLIISPATDTFLLRSSLGALGGSVEAALERFTAALAARLGEWRRDGFAAVRAQWLAKAGPLGTEVDVKLGDELVRGRFGGVDGEGALLLETPSGRRRIVSGELLGRAA